MCTWASTCFCRAGTDICTPLDGVVEIVANNTAELDYGPMLVVRHQTRNGTPFFLCCTGHLSLNSVEDASVGDRLSAGDKIAEVGTPPEKWQLATAFAHSGHMRLVGPWCRFSRRRLQKPAGHVASLCRSEPGGIFSGSRSSASKCSGRPVAVMALHPLDLLAMAVYFAILIWIGVSVARSSKGESGSESFLAADRDMKSVANNRFDGSNRSRWRF